MTQPTEAVGGASDTVVAAEPTLTDRLSAALDAPQEEDKKPEEEEGSTEAPQAEAEPELTAEDVTEDEAPEEAPIKPPVSWTAEEQEEFKTLPPAAQKTIARREAEREKFVQAKAQEAAQARRQVESEAVETLTQIQNTYAQQLQALLPPLAPMPQRTMLDINSNDYDPDGYHYLKAVHEDSLAQRHWAQQQLQEIGTRQQQAQQAQRNQELQEMEATLKDKFPEYLSPEHGPQLRKDLGAVAIELGFSSEELANPTARDILAMRTVANLKAKADKYDALMAKKMETVRSAKTLPRVTRPGVASGAAVNEAYTRDRQAMREGDMQAAARAVSRFL